METYVWWAIAGIALIIVEMSLGTLVLLVLGLAALAGAAAAWLGLSFWLQALLAVALAAIGMIVLSSRKKAQTQVEKNQDSLDVGQTVMLESWVSEADGMAKVRYRNATWDAKVIGPHTPGDTVFHICAMQGSTLQISSDKPHT